MTILKPSLLALLLASLSSLAAHAAPLTQETPSNLVSPAANSIIIPGTEVVLDHLPRLRNQGPLRLDFALAAQTVVQSWICRTDTVSHCAELPAEKEISPLSVAAWADLSISPILGDNRPHPAQPFVGTAFQVLKNIRDNMVFYPESCYPYDRLSEQYAGQSTSFESMLTRVHSAFLTYRNTHDDKQDRKSPPPAEISANHGTPTPFCEDCLLHDLHDGLLMNIDDKALQANLKHASYADFMLQGFFGQCHDSISADATPGFDYFPDHQADSTNATQVEDRLHDIIVGLKVPVAIDGVCMATDTAGHCTERQAVTVTGYRKVCRNAQGDGCEDAFRLRTASGKTWQDAHAGGWVLASSLFQNTHITTGTLSWYISRR